MQKIAFVISAFGGSTMPLVETFLKLGYNVDLYNCVDPRIHKTSFESFEVYCNPSICEVRKVKSFGEGMHRFREYSQKGQFKMFQVGHLRITHTKNRFLQDSLMHLFILYFAKLLKKQSYLFVNVIGQQFFLSDLSARLTSIKVNVFHSLHEVFQDHLNGRFLDKTITPLLSSHVPINVFSQKTANDLKQMLPLNCNKITYIPFGLFTGYLEYDEIEIPELNGVEDYILFYGYIRPYKGLNVLYKAVQKLRARGFYYPVVIAGSNNNALLDEMKKSGDFIIINKWLDNASLVTLIKRCHVVVCPYLSSSQTGITQTVFNFDKPIIASKVSAFLDTIEDNITGMLVNVSDSEGLCEKMIESYENKKLYLDMCNNIMDFRIHLSSENWVNIAQKYIKNYTKEKC